MRITMKVDDAGLQRALDRLGQNAIRAEIRALKRTIASVKVQARRAIAEDLGVTQKAVERSLRVQEPTFSNPIATLFASGKRLPLTAFGARQTKKGVTYRLPGGGNIVLSGFLAQVRSPRQEELGLAAHFGAFRRVAGQGPFNRRRKRGARRLPAAGEVLVARLPIKERFGPSIPHVAVKDRIRQALVQHGAALLRKNLAHEVNFLTQSSGGGGFPNG